MRILASALTLSLLLAVGASAAIINEISYGDFSDNALTPTPLAGFIGCDPFPPGCTDQINGEIDDVIPDNSDAFMFWAGAIEGITMSLTFNAQPSSGEVILYDPISMIAYGLYSFSGNVPAGFDLLAAWGLGTSGDGMMDLPGGIYAIGVGGTNWAVPGATSASYSISITAAPEPSTYLLVGLGLAGLALVRRRRRV